MLVIRETLDGMRWELNCAKLFLLAFRRRPLSMQSALAHLSLSMIMPSLGFQRLTTSRLALAIQN